MRHRVMEILILIPLLACCQAETPAARDAPVTDASLAQAGAAQNPPDDPEESHMQKRCGDAEIQLIVEGETGASVPASSPQRTALRMIAPDGTAREIARPEELSDYTAVGLGCATSSKDGQPYFVVQYGELPFGCSFCEWYYLYDARGMQLTRSNPPLLEDQTMPEGQKQYPNNREYQALLKTLELEQPEIEFVE